MLVPNRFSAKILGVVLLCGCEDNGHSGPVILDGQGGAGANTAGVGGSGATAGVNHAGQSGSENTGGSINAGASGVAGNAGVGGSSGTGLGGANAGTGGNVGGTGGSGAGGGYQGPSRYSFDELQSPLTESVAKTLRDIAAMSPSSNANVFMKIGASGTVSKNLLYCFAGDPASNYVVDLAGHDSLMPTIEYFRGGDAAGSTPFDRDTLAAQVGKTASWVLSGNPSPVEQELSLLNPRFAFVNYGTNDMGLGATYESALFPFYENMSELLDLLQANGVVPIITGLNPRSDNTSAPYWVPTYSAVTMALAESRQLPFIHLYLASKDLPGMGLGSDGLHGTVYSTGGQTQPCVFTSEALDYNYNIRNLLTIDMLDKVKRIVNDNETPSLVGQAWVGSGSTNDPILINKLPFSHSANTSQSPYSQIDEYSGCMATQNESGPEYYYSLEVSVETHVRIVLLDLGDTDVDIHLLTGSGQSITGQDCRVRDNRLIQGVLQPGQYTIVADSYVSSGVSHSGPYTLVIIECEPNDPDCDNAL